MAKAKQVQLQTDITSDEEWAKFLQREGLLVIDIYSEWCGPCLAMQGNLKKIKLEYGGDFLQLGMARCNYIEDLSRFRGKSEPSWMFIAQAQQVNLLFGSNAPELQRIILDELRKEKECLEGTRTRKVRKPSDYSEQEQEHFDKLIAIEAARERVKKEKALKLLKERRIAQAKNILDTMAHLGLIVIFPHAIKKFQEVMDAYIPNSGIAISKKERPQLTEEALEDIEFLAQEKDKIPEACKQHLISERCMAVMLTVDQEAVPGPLDETVIKFAYGHTKLGPGEPGTPAYDLLKSQIAKREREAIPEPEPEVEIVGEEVAQLEEEEGEDEEVMEEELVRKRSAYDSAPAFVAIEVVMEEEVDEEEVVEEEDLWGLWAPCNELVKSTALKYCFPLITSALILPEPEPTPPHFAVAFETFKKHDVFKLINEYEPEIMAYGFFSSDQANEATLIAKTKKGYEKAFTGVHNNERLVVKVAKRRSDPLLAFAQLGPTYMSSNADSGERDCSMFFPENYDDPEPQEAQKMSIVAVDDTMDGDDMIFDSVLHGEDGDFAELEGDVEEIPPMDPSELPKPEEDEEDQADKGTSPPPPEAPPAESAPAETAESAPAETAESAPAETAEAPE